MPTPSSRRLTLRRLPGEEAFELVYPPCAEECAEDMDEVRAMLAAGETDVAVDELLWLLEQCGELLEAHQLLGEIALSGGDLPLARGHFGRAFELGLAAFPESGPARVAAVRASFEPGLFSRQAGGSCGVCTNRVRPSWRPASSTNCSPSTPPTRSG